jgi:hypothetical protein
MSIETILRPILAKLSGLGKHQTNFLVELMTCLLGRQGRATFENLARYSRFTELTFRRQFCKYFDWTEFNIACVDFKKETYIGIVDCSFIPKSGKATFGVGKFWSSCAGKALQGLEVSVVACVGIVSKQTWAINAKQTPAKLPVDNDKNATRMDFYLAQIATCLPRLSALKHWVGDGYYAKDQVFNFFQKHNRYFITRLRSDADLYHLWDKGRVNGQKGRTRIYDGKVVFDDLTRWESSGPHPIHESISLHSRVLYSKRFKRKLLVVLLLDTKSQKYVLLSSTDLKQSPSEVAAYYHLRFGIEILFRDAKQFTGLTHCQGRSQAKIDYHMNASLSTVNIARLLLIADASLYKSMNALVRRTTSRRIWATLYEQLSLEGLVDLNRFESLQCQFWHRRAA